MADNVLPLIGKHGAEVEGPQRRNAEGAEVARLCQLLRRKRQAADLVELESRARDFPQSVADAVPLRFDEFLRAVEVEVARPEGEARGLGRGFELIHVDAARIVQDGEDPGILRLGAGRTRERRSRACRWWGSTAIHKPCTILLCSSRPMTSTSGMMSRNFGTVTMPVAKFSGGRHEPEAHLGHDAVVRLLEQPIDARTETRLELLPGLGAGQSAHPGAHHPAVGQDHLDAALGLEMAAVGREGDADAAVQRIAQHTAPARARDSRSRASGPFPGCNCTGRNS